MPRGETTRPTKKLHKQLMQDPNPAISQGGKDLANFARERRQMGKTLESYEADANIAVSDALGTRKVPRTKIRK